MSPVSSYLSGCGVLGTFIFALGFTTTSYRINEIGSTLSFRTNRRNPEPGREMNQLTQ